MFTISNNMRSADTTRVTEVIKSHVPILNTLGPRDNFGRIRFVVRFTPTNGTKFLPYRQRGIVQCGREETGWDGNDCASMA